LRFIWSQHHIRFSLEMMDKPIRTIIIFRLSHQVGSAQHVFFFHSLLSLVICMLTLFILMSSFTQSIHLFLGPLLFKVFFLSNKPIRTKNKNRTCSNTLVNRLKFSFDFERSLFPTFLDLEVIYVKP
jgi:hypothetical protein